MKNVKIFLSFGIIILLIKLIVDNFKIPKFEISSISHDLIRGEFDGNIFTMGKNKNDSFVASNGYVLISQSDNTGATFTLYKEDKVIKKFNNVLFNT